jgi:hypothetical protein
MQLSKNFSRGILFCLIAVLAASCSGTGESGTSSSDLIRLSPLIVTDRVSVVTAQTSSSGKPQPAGKQSIFPLLFGKLVSALSASTDYATDKVSVYVNERSLESFRSVNEILCMVHQSRYDLMLSKGPYVAQVDKNLCSSSRDSASSAGQSSTDQSSGSTMPQYETWTVDSYRTSAQAPHVVRVWVHSPPKPGEPDMVINAQLIITEGADTAPPYGIFKINFKALDAQNLSIVRFKGFLNAERDPVINKVVLKFSTEDKDSYVIEKAALDKRPDGTGAGSVLKVESYPGITPKATRFNLAYDADHFLRTDSTGSVCLNRQTPDISAWRYGLYNQNGDRVKQNSGFPVHKGSDYGWIGYWGTYFPSNASLANNDQVVQHDYATNTDTMYTVLKTGGKLKKHTLNITDLGHIQNVPLIWYDAGSNYQVAWNGSAFEKIARQNPAPDYTWSTCGITTTCTPSTIDISSISWPDIAFWSQSLSGLVIVKLGCTGNGPFSCTADSLTPVVVLTENIVYPKDFTTTTTLACFDNCPDVNMLSTDTPYRTDIMSYQSVTSTNAAYAAYTLDPATVTLYSGAAGTIPMTTAVTGTNFTNGVSSGPLFDPAATIVGGPNDGKTYLEMMACTWDLTKTCGSNAWSVLPAFYTWETGPNEWNKFTGLLNALGDPVTFDPPRQVLYTHHELGNKYDNASFYLEYSGFGDLHGIPGKCVNIDTSADADCSTSGSNPAIRWVPEFTIPDVQISGDITEVTDMTTQAPFLVKALEKEERMKVAAPGSCDSLDTTAYILPSMSSWSDPIIGTEPIITAPPAVVGGVVQ